MRKMKITIILLALTINLFAPATGGLVIEVNDPVKPYERIIHAVGMVETKLDTLAYNPEEKAVGFFQVRPIRVKDYNELTGDSLTLADMYDYNKAKKVFMYYALQFHYSDYQGIAKDWNKSRTNRYWNKVKKHL